MVENKKGEYKMESLYVYRAMGWKANELEGLRKLAEGFIINDDEGEPFGLDVASMSPEELRKSVLVFPFRLGQDFTYRIKNRKDTNWFVEVVDVYPPQESMYWVVLKGEVSEDSVRGQAKDKGKVFLSGSKVECKVVHIGYKGKVFCLKGE